MTEKQTWACHLCGATTDRPEDSLIVYFHDNCPARKKQGSPA